MGLPVDAPEKNRPPSLTLGADRWDLPEIPPRPTFEEADELARFVLDGAARFGWDQAEVEYVRAILGLVRAKTWRATLASVVPEGPRGEGASSAGAGSGGEAGEARRGGRARPPVRGAEGQRPAGQVAERGAASVTEKGKAE
jgi:hypothetical protein